LLHPEFFASGAESPSFYHPGNIPGVSRLTWVGYSIFRDYPIPPSKRGTRFGGSRRWHCGLASKNSTQHLMI